MLVQLQIEEEKQQVLDKLAGYFYQPLLIAQNVLISDIDYIPLPSWYYQLSAGHPQKCFIGMRKKDGKNFFMGFNSAHPDTWARVFKLTDRTIDGVCNKMLEWSNNGKTHPGESYKPYWSGGWCDDQCILNNAPKIFQTANL